MQLLEVLIEYSAHSLDHPFSYVYSGSKQIKAGIRVLVTFNHREIVGYVIGAKELNKSIEELEDETGLKIEEITSILDEEPILNNDLLNLCDEVAKYYLAPKISVLQAMLPPSLSPKHSSLKAPKIAFDKYVILKNDDESNLTSKQIEVFRMIKSETKVLKREIKSLSILNKLIEFDRVEIINEEKRRLKLPDYTYQEPPLLSADQQNVINEFNKTHDDVYLLEGVTGSGKTEVYLTLSENALKEGKSVLMLVPEISLTPMMMEYFIRRFKNNVALLHSELTPAEKYDEYRKISRGECKVVIGARSAIFAPLRNIGLIILDEEHVESYKQDVTPFYHAREVAIMRAKDHCAKVLLGSATPSLESRARAQKNVYHHLRLEKRINNQRLPQTAIINMLDYRNIDRDSYIFSKTLRREIQKVLDNHEQAILLINRRGFSTNVSCRKCGHVFRCPTCGIALTYHKTDNMLKCHHCEYVQVMPDKCDQCGSEYLMKTGFGTEKIEEEIHRLFKKARVLRLDSDSAKVRTKIPSIIESFRKKEADILLGTQMIAKGHDFPDVTLVGIVLADIGLSMPNYRSAERTFQLITQAVGRGGRKDKDGVAIIQTYMPSHYAITMGARQDYELFYKKEMKMRKEQNYPPYTFLASLTISGKNEEAVVESTYDTVDFLNHTFGEEGQILGPTTPYIAKVKDLHIRTILVKYRNYDLMHDVLKKVLVIFKGKNNVNILINIDPYNF